MADVVSPAVRSRIMSKIRGKNTGTEMIVRRGLFARGFRYRLHDQNLPGKPDLVFPRRRAVIFVHGCFWHGHDCHLFKWPVSRSEFWKQKIENNRTRDSANIDRLLMADWRVLVIWECALRGRHKWPVNTVLDDADQWLRSDRRELELMGTGSVALK